MNGVTVELVRTEAQAVCVRTMVWEFFAWQRERNPDLVDAIDEYLARHDVAGQLDRLLDVFAPPASDCLLGRLEGDPAGIVMLKSVAPGVCEMNRMFVRPEARGHGIGRALSLRLIERARELGHGQMILSTFDRNDEALGLYRSLGFAPDRRAAETTAGAGREVAMRLSLTR